MILNLLHWEYYGHHGITVNFIPMSLTPRRHTTGVWLLTLQRHAVGQQCLWRLRSDTQRTAEAD